MRIPRWLRWLPALAGGCAASVLLLGGEGSAFTTLGFSLGLEQRDGRVFNNFLDPTANDNTTPDPNWPGSLGAPLAIWKTFAEWGSSLHGDGLGDPSQPGDVGSGGANFDVTWQGLAPDTGGIHGNVVSAINCGGGTISFTEGGVDGWRIRLCEEVTWDDGPGVTITGMDIQGIVAHEFGHVIGLGHSNVGGSTMFPSVSGNGVSARSIEADDKAGVQFVYGPAGPTKPRIDGLVSGGGVLAIFGANFTPTDNEVWFTQAGLNRDGSPVVVSGLSSLSGGTQIALTVPALAGPGDVLVRIAGSSGAALSNAFPFDGDGCLAPTVYCTAKTNSLGCTSAISASGVPSVSAGSGFSIDASQLLNNVSGVLFYSVAGPGATPFQGGFLCAAPPVTRTVAQNSGGTPPPASDCTGTFAFDFNTWVAGGSDPALVLGRHVWAQYWSRDPGIPPPNNTNLTDAVAFVLCP